MMHDDDRSTPAEDTKADLAMTRTDDHGTPPKEPRSKAGWIALLFVLGLVGWMASGYLAEDPAAPAADTPREREEAEPFTVEAFASEAKSVTRFVAAEGQAKPDRQTPVRAKTGGTIEEIVARKGQFLNEGDVIARIALADRGAQIAQAEAELRRRQGEFDRVRGLADRGYATDADVESIGAALAVAEAGLASIRQTEGDTEIRAPITGVLENFDLDLGEFIAASSEIGTQVDNDPLTVEIQVAQQNIGRIQRGQKAHVGFITGSDKQGEVTYVATNANAATRTFPVEITVPNPDRTIPAGISAEVRIPVGETPAHFLSAAILALGPDGELGVKAVDDEGKVAFFPANLVRAETDGIWVDGLPETLRIISVGQGFVTQGQTVRAVAPRTDGLEVAPPSDAAPDPTLPGIAEAGSETPDASGLMSGTAPSSGGNGAISPQGQVASDEVALLAGAIGAPDGGAIDPGIVRTAQEALNALGYEAGPADGVMGAATRSAIRAFETDYGMETTGTLSEAFANALRRALGTGGADR